MRALWRVALVISAAVLMAVMTVLPVVAQKGGFGGLLAEGTYQFTTQRAGFFVNQPYPGPQISVSATRTTDVSKPEGALSTTTTETDVFVSVQDYVSGIFGGGCFVLDQPADFKVAANLSAASLKTTITSMTATCFGSGSLPFPFSIDIAWSGTGPIATFTDESRYQCLTYRSETVTKDRGNNASATASLSGFSSPFTNQSGFGDNDQHVQARGPVPATCPPGGTKGAGSGPHAPGSYRIFGPHVDAVFGSFPGPLTAIAVNDITQQSHPKGSPATTTRDIDLNVQMFGAVNGSGCWVISTSDFTSTGVTSASLQTSITDATPTCPSPFPNSLPLPLAVKATWNGTGPVVTVRDENTFKCLGFSQGTHSVIRSNNATATATVTVQQATSTLTGGQASLVTGDQRIQVEGVDPQPCLVRG